MITVEVIETKEHERTRLDMDQANQVLQQLQEQAEIDDASFIYSQLQASGQLDSVVVKHTPGPWGKGKTSDSIINPNLKNMGQFGPGCDKHYGGRVICESVARHNQPLICAAPDMLKALKKLVKHIEGCSVTVMIGCGLEEARAAIAKAEGRHA